MSVSHQIDVSTSEDWQKSEFKIKGTIRKRPKLFDSWANEFPRVKDFVLYRAWPNEETSAGLAQKLLNRGYAKVYALKGGWNDWSMANYPVEKKSPLLLW
jgi:rhodanese-related sulfurtransferase